MEQNGIECRKEMQKRLQQKGIGRMKGLKGNWVKGIRNSRIQRKYQAKQGMRKREGSNKKIEKMKKIRKTKYEIGKRKSEKEGEYGKENRGNRIGNKEKQVGRREQRKRNGKKVRKYGIE